MSKGKVLDHSEPDKAGLNQLTVASGYTHTVSRRCGGRVSGKRGEVSRFKEQEECRGALGNYRA